MRYHNIEMIEVKKVVLIVFIVIAFIFGISFAYLQKLKTDNNKIQKEISRIEVETQKMAEENITTEKNIIKSKEENKDKWEENAIWEKAKEKLTKAISE